MFVFFDNGFIVIPPSIEASMSESKYLSNGQRLLVNVLFQKYSCAKILFPCVGNIL